MSNVEEFLNFVFENLQDDRVTLHKKMKYGFRHYHVNITLRLSDDSNRHRDTKTLQVIVDCRNNCIEIGEWEELLVFEGQELTTKWANKLEEIYSNLLDSQLSFKIDRFFNKDVNVNDRDFPRRWKMKDWFRDDEESEQSF